MLYAPVDRLAPTDGKRYPWITKSFWRFSCLPGLQSGHAGEGFLAIAPDGTRYTFDWMTKHSTNYIKAWFAGNEVIDLYRDVVAIFPTRIEDRFGNWVTISYGSGYGRPTLIQSSDGRFARFHYNAANRISQVETSVGTWTYVYDGAQLREVVQPDNSRWQQQMARVFGSSALTMDHCSPTWQDSMAQLHTSTINHPSGATGTFQFRDNRFWRDDVPATCYDPNPDKYGDEQIDYPLAYDVASLASKSISGPGLVTGTWSYRYLHYFSNPQSPWGTTITEVTQPDGSVQRTGFGNRFGSDDGLTLWSEIRDAQGVVKQRQDMQYELSTAGAWCFGRIGESTNLWFDSATSERLRPTRSTVLIRDGVNFNSRIDAYESNFCKPASVTKSSSLGYSKTDVTAYHDDLSQWVLGQIKTSSTEGIQVSRTDYDTRAMPWKTYRFGKLQQTLGYYADGTLATATDGRNNTITLSGWKRGIPQSIQHPDTTTQSAVVDDRGWITSVTDENGSRHCYSYDAMGRISGITYPSEATPGLCDSSSWNVSTQSFQQINVPEYGIPAGHWRQSVSTGNARTQTYFDALWRPLLTETYDAADPGNTLSRTVKRYDVAGRLAFQSYPLRTLTDYAAVTQGTRSFYDPLDRVTRVEQDSELGVLATTTEYLSGFQTRVTNARGYLQAISGYQVYDQPSYDLLAWSVQAHDKITEIYRDPFGKPTHLLQRSGDNSVQASRRYVYDNYQQLCKTIEPETGATVMWYDAAGNLEWSAAGLALPDVNSCNINEGLASGRKVERYYDARNRLTTLAFADGRGNQSREYTADGKPKRIVTYNEPGGTAPVENTYTYNRRGLMTAETTAQSWYTWPIGYGYNANGHLASQVSPTYLTLSYAPNALGQPTAVGNQWGGVYAGNVSYHPNGAIAQFTYGNGITHTLQQNARQLPARSTDTWGALDYGYTYDANANPTLITDYARGGDYSRWLSYDGLDRLTDAGSCSFGGDCWHRFSYDALDNLKSWKLAGVKDYANYYYDPTSNRLTNIQNTAGATVVGLGYDAQGNLSNKNGQGYDFDYGNRLRTVYEKEFYRYDGHGRRAMAWRQPGHIVLSMYGSTGQLAYQSDESKAKSFDHVYLGGSLVASIEYRHSDWAATTQYQHTDALGSPVAVTDSAGFVIDRTQYEPYGAAVGKPAYDGIGYSGHVMDGATGLTYMQQRYYDPGVGRFLSVDPVTANPNTGANFNRYAYVSNNPYKFKDPDGRYECAASKDQCKAVAKAVKDIASASRSSIAGGTRIPKISNFLGKEGQKNGVVIKAGGDKSLGSAKTENGVTTLSVNFKGANSTDKVSSVITHEASHGIDQRAREKQGLDPMTTSRTDLNISELNANLAEASLFKALGRDSPYGMWTREGGVNNEKINSDADRSVNSVCSQMVCDP